MSDKVIIGILLAAFIAIAIFARGDIAGVFIVLAIAAIAIASAQKKKT